MVTLAVGATGWILGAAALVVALRVHRRIRALVAPAVTSYDDSELREVMAACVAEIDQIRADYVAWSTDINLAVAEGIKNVERAENRIRATVRRAREQLSEHGLESPGLEAEYRDLRVVDGDGGQAEEMPAVREDVAGAEDQFAGLPGDWSAYIGRRA